MLTHICKTESEARAIVEGRAPIVVQVERTNDFPVAYVVDNRLLVGHNYGESERVEPPFPAGSEVEINYWSGPINGKRFRFALGTVTAGEAEVKRAGDLSAIDWTRTGRDSVERFKAMFADPDTILWIIPAMGE